MTTKPGQSCRSGLTLLEIVLSLALFFGAITALSQLAWNGTRATVQARLKTQATIRCEATMNEVLAGAIPMQAQAFVPFLDDPNWNWTLTVAGSPLPELVQLDVTVSHSGNSPLTNASVTLRRWARQQAAFVQAATQQKEEADAKPSP